MEEEPYKAITMIRFTLIPTFAKNYGLAALDAPISGIVVGNIVSGLFFGSVFCYMGQAAKSLSELVGAEEKTAMEDAELLADEEIVKEANPLVQYASITAGLVFTLIAMVVIKRRVREEIAKSERAHAAKEVKCKRDVPVSIPCGSASAVDRTAGLSSV